MSGLKQQTKISVDTSNILLKKNYKNFDEI